MEAEGTPVLDYAFVSASNFKMFSALTNEDFADNNGYLSAACEYDDEQPQIRGIPENFLDVVYQEYYDPDTF